MFDYTLAHWGTFFIAAVLLNLTPGPDIAYVLAHTAKNGQRAGFVALFGVWAGLFLHVLLAALGLSAILATSATAFMLIKWLGALYLIWLGIQCFRSTDQRLQPISDLITPSERKIFSQGVLVATLNPKSAFFFLAFLPQFVVTGAGPVSTQLLLHGMLILVVGAFIEPVIVLLSAKLSDRLRQNSRLTAWMDRILGLVFIGLGVRIALSEQA